MGRFSDKVSPVQLAHYAATWAGGPGEPDKALEAAAAAVCVFMDRQPFIEYDDKGYPLADAMQAASMLTARLYRRRHSLTGTEAVSDLGIAYVAKYDPDIARMLRLDRYAPPVIA